MNEFGDIALGYSISGKDLNPSIRFTGRKESDPINQMTFIEQNILEGNHSQSSANPDTKWRWGDYSMMSVDPVNNSFWYTNEYIGTANTTDWKTRIASFSLDCAVFTDDEDEFISRVQLGTLIDNASNGWSQPDGYGDFRHIIADMQPGSSENIIITLGSPNVLDKCGIWVDWDQNGNYQDIDEVILPIDGTPSTGFTATIDVPSFAKVGITTLRVRICWDDVAEPCDTCFYGEVEDYSIRVSPYMWEGTLNEDWSMKWNWLNQQVPNSLIAKVSIPDKTNDPVIYDNSIKVKNLTIGNSANLTISPMGDLTVMGNLINNGTLTIASDQNGTGSLIHKSAGVNGIVKRYLTQEKWHFFSSPVSNATATIFDLPPGESDIYLRTHVQNGNTWGPWITNPTTALLLGRGYEVWVDDNVNQDETVEINGVLNTNNYTTGAGGFYPLEFNAGHGLNLIGNPYPSAIEANIHQWTKANVANSVWTWSPDDANYVYWNGIDGTNTNGYGTMTGGIIPSMQGFFVLATAAAPSLTIPQSSRLHSDQAYYKSIEEILPENTLKITCTGNNYKDVVYISFNENATNEFDPKYDVLKIFGLDEAPQLYSVITGNELSINSICDIHNNRIVELRFKCGLPEIFKINTEGQESFYPLIPIIFEDFSNNYTQNIRDIPEYSFSYQQPGEELIFYIHFYIPDDIDLNEYNRINIYSFGKTIYLDNTENLNGQVCVYDRIGKQIHEQNIRMGLNEIVLDASIGYYIVRFISDNYTVSKKVFID